MKFTVTAGHSDKDPGACANGYPLACGVETIALPKDKALAQNISSAIACTLGTKLRGDTRGKLGFVSNGGLIIEVCFITNKAEMDSYQDRKWLVASAIARVLNEWSKS